MKKNPVRIGCIGFVFFLVLMTCLEKKEVEKASFFQEKRSVSIEGQVKNIEEEEDFQILYLHTLNGQSSIQEKISFPLWGYQTWMILYPNSKQISKKNQIQLGDKILVKGKTLPFLRGRNQGEFSEFLHQYSNGIRYKMESFELEVIERGHWKFRNQLFQWKKNWTKLIEYEMGEKYGSVIATLLFGEKRGMEEGLKKVFMESGIGHIFVISGLHIGLFGWGMYQLIRRMFDSRIWAMVFLGVFFLFYTLLIGPQISFLRGMCFLVFQIGEDILGKRGNRSVLFFLSLALVLGIQPRSIFSRGFYLSYGSVLGVWFGKEILRGQRKKEVAPFLRKGLYGILFSSVLYGFLLPMYLFFFYETTLWSILWNFISVPLAMPLLLLSVVGLCGTKWGIPFVSIAWRLSSYILMFYEKGSRFFLSLPIGKIVLGRPKIWQMVLLYFVLGWVWWQKKRSQENREGKARMDFWRKVILGVGISFLGISLLLFSSKEYQVRITVLDVGQGDGILIQGPKGGIYLVDGGSLNIPKVGRRRILPFLKYHGISKIDYVFISHGDRDHYSGVLELLEEMTIQYVVFPDPIYWDENLEEVAKLCKQSGVETLRMKEGEGLQEADFKITCLYPFLEKNAGIEVGNETSMVLEIQYHSFEMLLTGDLEKRGEEVFREKVKGRYSKNSLEVLKAGHHGSKFSTSEAFLEEVRPRIAVLSAGETNPFGHPHKETLERLENIGSQTYQTNQIGEVDIYVKEREFWVEGYLENLK